MKPIVERFQFITGNLPHLTHADQVARACRAGVRWIQLRMKQYPYDQWLETAFEARRITEKYHARLIINDDPQIAHRAGADGVHLGIRDVSVQHARRLLGSERIIGFSVHNQDELAMASQLDINYLGIGPFRTTTTKPDHDPVLGVGGLRRLCGLANAWVPGVPVIAVGGIGSDDLNDILACGCWGVAVSSAISFDGNEQQQFDAFLTKLSEAEIC